MTSPARIKTNQLLAKAFDLNDFLDPTRLAHDELQYYNDLTRAFDKTISKYIDWLDTPEARKLFYEQIKAKEEYFETIDKDIDDIIQDTSLSTDRIIEKIYNKGLQYGYKDINRLPVFNDACKYGLKATQEYNFELIQSVTEDLKKSIKHHIFRGVAEGQSVHEVARAITDSGLKPLEGKTLTAYQRASLIARTEIARSMSTGRLQAYANYDVEKVKILTAGDDNVCPICLEAAHKFNGEMSIEHISGDKLYSLEEASNLIPFHPACRCSIIAHIEHFQDIPQKSLGEIDCDRAPKPIVLTPKGIEYNEKNSYLNRKESQEIADELGFKYEYDSKRKIERFIDNEFDVILEFPEFSLTMLNFWMKQEGINVYYTKRDILTSYSEAPDIFKYASSKINFISVNNSKLIKNSIGDERGLFNPETEEIEIFIQSFLTPVEKNGNPKFTIRHEMVHALDYHMNPNPYIKDTNVGKYGLSSGLFDDENQTHFSDAIRNDNYVHKRHFSDEDLDRISDHPNEDRYSENFAISMAICSFEGCNDQSPILLIGPEGKKLTLDQWKKRNPNRYEYYQKRIKTLTKIDFKK